MNCIHLILTSILVGQVFTQFQIAETDPKCGDRECVIISKCPSVLKLVFKVFQVKAGSQDAKRRLLDRQCGFERNLPKVCCDRNSDNKESPRIFSNSQATTSITTVKAITNQNMTTVQTTPFTTSTEPPSTANPLPIFITRTISDPKDELAKLNSPKCGVRTSLNFRITFGETAANGQFPWVVSLIYKNRRRVAIPLCGGALISNRHVVTAAHCDASQSGFSLSSVILGQTDLSAPVTLPGIEIDVGEVVRHPQFKRNPVAVMDIAIIKLARTVRFTDRIRPICVFHPDLEEVENPPNGLIVAGWGRTEKERSSDLLQYTFLEPVPMRQCQAEYGIAGKEGKLGPITDLEILKSQLCAQGVGATDSCTGDSGGPLMAQVGNTWYLAGVVSFGTQKCDSSLPGIYTRLSHFYSWILRTLQTF